MMDFVRKHRETIFIITITGFLAGIFVGFGSYFFIGKTTADNVIEVNGSGVPYRRYSSLLNQVEYAMRHNNESTSEEVMAKKKQEILQQLIQEELFWQEAQKYGIMVSDTELANDLANYPAFQRNGKFSHMLYYQILGEVLRSTPREFEESRKKQIAAFRLRELIAEAVRITEPQLEIEYAKANRGNMAGFAKDRETFLVELKKRQASMVFADWLRYLNQNLKVQIHLDEIEQKFKK